MRFDLEASEMCAVRVLVAVAAVVFGVAGASAADTEAQHMRTGAIGHTRTSGAEYTHVYNVTGNRSEQIVVYDFQPGVVVREYWRAPWAHRHYFPRTGHKPKYGRAENLFAKRIRPEPARIFQRVWSTSWLSPPEPREPYGPPPPLRGK